MVRWSFSKARSEESIESSSVCSSGVTSSSSSLSSLPTSSETRRWDPPKSLIVSQTVSMQFAAGFSTACFYPFDVVKTRYMSQDGTVARQHNGRTYRSMTTSFSAIYRAEGARALFRGLSVTLVGATSAWGIYMFMYRSLCYWADSSSYITRSGLSLLSSLTSTFLTSPIFFIKSRMQLEEIIAQRSTVSSSSSQGLSPSADSHSSRTYATFRSGFKHILETHGICGLWKGISLQLILVFPYFLAFPTYDFFKSILVDYHLRRALALSSMEAKKKALGGNLSEEVHENTAAGTGFYTSWFSLLLSHRPTTSSSAPPPSSSHQYQNYSLNLLEIAFCSGLTKVFLLILSHPLIMLRVRIQDQRAMEGDIHYDRIRKSFKTVLRHQGVLGMYRGFVPSLVHILPRGVMQYTVYELCLKCLTP